MEIPPEEQGICLTVGSPAQNSGAGKRSLHNFCLRKLVEIAAEWDGGLWQSQAFLLKGLYVDSLMDSGLTHSELSEVLAESIVP